ncbi:MAG: DUF6754 domain-containing protein [Anaerolineales bacterium]
MAAIEGVLALVVGLLLAGLILFFTFLRRGQWPTFRRLPALEALSADIGRSVESGTRLHLSLGNGSMYGPEASATLVGLAALSQIAKAGSVSDKPPLATSADGAVTLLSQDVYRVAFRHQRAEDRYDPLLGRIAGLGPLGYAAGTMHTAPDEDVTATFILGPQGREVALVAEAGSRRGDVVGGTLDPVAQAVLYATADHPLIGEELFATGAYLKVNRAHAASVQAQDVMRWVVIGAAVALAVLGTVGIL